MITIRLLMPLLRSQDIEAVLSSVIERTNSTGALCHEETIGEYAAWLRQQEGLNGSAPLYDYKARRAEHNSADCHR